MVTRLGFLRNGLRDIELKKELIMKCSNFAFRLIIFVLSASILLIGCHSYYAVSEDDYSNLETMDDVKIVYKNGKEFVVEKNDTTKVEIVGDSLVVYQGSEKNFIPMNEVKKISESRFDLGGTITISITALTFLLVLFLLSNPFKT
jgi:hypothetical protein